MYTWGYLKNVALAKLDLTEEEAETQQLIDKFPYYANEVITQICSSIKPKNTFAEFVVTDDPKVAEEKGHILVGTQVKMPSDFIGFGDDVNERSYQEFNLILNEIACDQDFKYLGYNKVMFKRPGTYQISYKARWIDFNDILRVDELGNEYQGPVDDSYELDVPADILDCIPAYIASQCFKIDDQYKSQVFRNEYEMSLARIDDTDFKNTKTFMIGGDW